MNNIQEFDYSLDFLQSILWQYNDAENIAELLQKKQDWYTENHTNFWNDWVTDVFDLRTANDFGLNVWSIILDLPLYGDQEPSPADYPAFGFGAFGMNFGNGNFATDADGFTGLSIQEKRILLQLKFFSLVNDATVPTINEFLNYLFGDNYVYVVDNYNMTMEYVFVQDPGRRLLSAMTALDVLPRPSAVSLDVNNQNTILLPNAPTSLQATVVDSGGDLNFDNVQLNWTAPTQGFPFTYNIYRDAVLIASSVAVNSYLDVGLSGGTYTYTVSATNSLGEGAQSSPASAIIAGTPSATVFDVNKKSDRIDLTSGDLVATFNNNLSLSDTALVLGVGSVNSGKHYFEITFSEIGVWTGIGVGQTTADFDREVSVAPIGQLWLWNTSAAISYNGEQAVYALPGTVDDTSTIMVALDMDTGSIWFGANGIWVGDPAVGTDPAFPNTLPPTGFSDPIVGPVFPYVHFRGDLVNPNAITANFGASEFLFPVPAGFSPGFIV